MSPRALYRKIPPHKVGNAGFPKIDRRIRNVAAHAEGIWFSDFSPEIPIFISTFQFFVRFAGTRLQMSVESLALRESHTGSHVGNVSEAYDVS